MPEPEYRILAVDDDKDILRSIKIRPRLRNFKVDVYGDPAKALSEFQPRKYDLALSDVKDATD